MRGFAHWATVGMGMVAKLTSIAIVLSVLSAVTYAGGPGAEDRGQLVPLGDSVNARVSDEIRDLNDGFPGDEPEIFCRIEEVTGSHMFRRVCGPPTQADTERAEALAYLAGVGIGAEYSTGGGARTSGSSPPGGTGGGGYCE